MKLRSDQIWKLATTDATCEWERLLATDLIEARAALAAAEWGGRIGQEGEYRACPICGNPDPEDLDIGMPEKRKGPEDHEDGCALANALYGNRP